MPEPIAEVEQSGAAVARQRLAVLAEVGDVVEPGGEAVIFFLHDRSAARLLAFAKVQRKGELLLIGDVLAVEDQHGIFVHARFGLARLLLRQRLTQIETRNLTDKMLVQLTDGHRHGADLPDLVACRKGYSGNARCQRPGSAGIAWPRVPDAVQRLFSGAAQR